MNSYITTKVFESSNKDVKKFVFEFNHPSSELKNAVAEAVLYRYNSYRERTVICCSVMSGCPVGCSFCGTGKFFVRNLEPEEIVGQVRRVLSTIDCKPSEIKKFQIMFMSMGEPMMNFKNLSYAINELNADYTNAQLLISTSAPANLYHYMSELVDLSIKVNKVGLQFSVHESLDGNRHRLIPTKTCTLRQIAAAGEFWAANVGRKPYYNYCVHAGNDTEEDADRLIRLFNPNVWETTLSVICEKHESVKASIDRQLEVINRFAGYMRDRGASLRIFNPAGQDDIGGGCGQLWYFQKWLKEHKN